MTTDQALLKLTAITGQAAAEALRQLCGLQVALGPAKLIEDAGRPFDDVALPAVVARAEQAEGTGRLIAVPLAAARRIAAAMMGADAVEGETEQLSDIENTAFAEAIGDALTAASRAAGTMLGGEVRVDAPAIEQLTAHAADPAIGPDTHAVRVELTLERTIITLVQLVADSAVAGLVGALDGSLARHDNEPLKAALHDIPVRVWVELGRATMPLGRLVALPPGEVVELDHDAADPVDLYVDGMRVARGRLVVSDSGEFLTLRIESLDLPQTAAAA